MASASRQSSAGGVGSSTLSSLDASLSRIASAGAGTVDGRPELGAAIMEDAPVMAPAAKKALFAKKKDDQVSTSQLAVTLLGAKGLRAVDSNGLSDPYVIMWMGRETWRSREFSNTLNPVWGDPKKDRYTFGLGGDPKKLTGPEFDAQSMLYIKVRDRNTLNPDVDIGECRIFIGDLFAREPGMIDPVTNLIRPQINVREFLKQELTYEGAWAGFIDVRLEAIGYRTSEAGTIRETFEPVGDAPTVQLANGASVTTASVTTAARLAAPPNCLIVRILGGSEMECKNALVKTNPYVRLDISGMTVRTPYVDASNPTWNLAWAFPVVERATSMQFEVKHKHPFGAEFQGRVNLSVGAFPFQDDKPIDLHCQLVGNQQVVDRPRGLLHIQLSWVSHPLYAAYFALANQNGASRVSLQPFPLTEAGGVEFPDALLARINAGSGPSAGPPPGGAKAGSSGEVDLAATKEDEKASRLARESTLARLSTTEIKDGDWQVQLHIIEARNLAVRNHNGSSDPVVYVKIGDQTQHTRVHRECTSCVFDEYMFFSFPKVTRAELESLTIDVSVFDANLLLPSVLIGKFVFDPFEVYYQDNHCYHRRWVGLIETQKGKDRDLQGYLRMSVNVVGPGDQLYIADDSAADPLDACSIKDPVPAPGVTTGAEAMKDIQAGILASIQNKKKVDTVVRKADGELADADGEVSISSLVLLPPTIRCKTKWLVVTCHAAKDLPVMDLSPPGIDAYAQVLFAGNTPACTQWVSLQGIDKTSKFNVAWNRELWLPFNYPTFTNRVELSIYDYDYMKENDRVGTIVLDHRQIQAEGIAPSWWPVYGAPNTVFFGKMKNRMNRLPAFATTYRGSVLLSARVEEEADNNGKNIVHWKPVTALPKELLPPRQDFRVRALIFSGDELPCVSSWLSRLFNSKSTTDLGVCVSIGGVEEFTPLAKVVDGQASWNTGLEFKVSLPRGAGGAAYGQASKASLPDTIVYLYYGNAGKEDVIKICYARLDTARLIDSGFQGSTAYWQTMQEDMAVNAVSDNECAGTVLMRIGLDLDSKASADTTWRDDFKLLTKKTPYEVRVHVYQGRELPSADANGSLDPYLKLSLSGMKRKTAVRYATVSPAWYQTICMEVSLPPLQFAQQLHLELWDADDLPFTDDFVSELRCNLADAANIITSIADMPEELPPPTWRTFTRYETGVTNKSLTSVERHGEILMSIQLIQKTAATEIARLVPATIVPEMRDMYLEIVALGCRNLAPFNYLPIQCPHVEFDAGSRALPSRQLTDTTEINRTVRSRYPSGTNPNFCDRLMLPIKIPKDPLFAPSINVSVFDNRLGGHSVPVIATAAVSLACRIPWADDYKPSRGAIPRIGSNPFRTDAKEPLSPSVEKEKGAVFRSQSAPMDTAAVPRPHPAAGALTTSQSVPLPGAVASPRVDNPLAASISPVQAETGAGAMPEVPNKPDAAVFVPEEPTDALVPLPDASAIDSDVMTLYGIDLSKYLRSLDAGKATDEYGLCSYLNGRREYNNGLEEVFGSAPFESFALNRGQSVGASLLHSQNRRVGTFKGIVRLCSTTKEPPLLDMQAVLNPSTCVVRLYVLSGHRMQPKDNTGSSDCYLVVKLGSTVISKRKSFIPQSTEPEFYESFELTTTLPGAALLTIEVWDYDQITKDDFIGRTTIDLEDRWFEPAWSRFGAFKPVERRDVWSPIAGNSQGQLRLWVDIMTPAEAARTPMIDIRRPPPQEYEVRMVVWKARKLANADGVTKMNDCYVKAAIEGMADQTTDVHLRAKKGFGSWNWRMKWNVTLPHKYFYLKVQAWDQDYMKYNDLIGEAYFDLGPMIKRCMREPTKGHHIIFNNPEVVAERKKRLRIKEAERLKKQSNPDADTQPLLGDSSTGASKPGPAAPQTMYQRATATVVQASTTVTTTVGNWTGRGTNAPTGATATETAGVAPSGASNTPAAAATGGMWGSITSVRTTVLDAAASTMTGASMSGLAGIRAGVDSGDTRRTILALKRAAGIEVDVHPDHADWVDLQMKGKPVGEVLVSIELLPKAVAEKYPAGFGQSEPNQFPKLPPPIGRMRCSLNPCYLCSEICGPKLCTMFACALCCMLIAAAFVFLAPFINTIVVWLQALPKSASTPLAILVALIIILPPLYCYCRFVCFPPSRDYDEAELDGSASDETAALMPSDRMPIGAAGGTAGAAATAEDASKLGTTGAGAPSVTGTTGEDANETHDMGV